MANRRFVASFALIGSVCLTAQAQDPFGIRKKYDGVTREVTNPSSKGSIADQISSEPKFPTKTIKPITSKDLQGPLFKRPKTTTQTAARPRALIQAASVKLGAPDWRFALPNSQILLGVNLKRLVQSTVVQSLFKEVSQQANLPAAQLEAMKRDLGGVDEICLSMAGRDMIILVSGRISSLPKPPRKAPMRIQPISLDQALVGADAGVIEAARRLANGTSSDTSKRAASMAAENDFWFFATASGLKQHSQLKATAAFDFANKIESLGVGLKLGKTIRLQTIFTAKSETDVETLAAEVNKDSDKLPKEIRSTTEIHGREVRVTLEVNESDATNSLLQAFNGPAKDQMTPFLAMITGGAKPPRQDGKVRIVGLEEGTREFELSKAPKP
ncbi:MAG TPA: hypothetical protein VE621_10315 [Bryobacteraceae bacterium]|nr:hypothetical protein [Bryobacteraceae bacterium]